MTFPTFNEEMILWQKGFKAVAGIDEVGRGCFAGPVVTASVIFPPFTVFSDPFFAFINDSKKVTEKRRVLLAEKIKEVALSISVSESPVERINTQGIAKATQESFLQTLKIHTISPDFVLVDAFEVHGFEKIKQKPLIHGDSLSISIAAASIVAKVYRDNLMKKLSLTVPEYGFDIHKGYGTLLHRENIKKFGLSKHHRTSFSLSKYLQ